MDMKEMVYRPYEKDKNGRIKSELLFSNIYRKIPYVITSYGDHPCAYIVNPFNNLTSYFDEKLDDIIVHGGFTFFGDLQHILPESLYFFKEKFLGWDYGHAGDYCNCTKHLNACGEKYSTLKIKKECKRVIDQILAQYLQTKELRPFVYKDYFDDIAIAKIINKKHNAFDFNAVNTNTSKKLFDICENILDVINMVLQGNNLNQAKEALILCKNGLELYEKILNKAIETMDKESKKKDGNNG